MADQDIAKALLQLLESSQFPGSARRQVAEIAEWLERLVDGSAKTVPAEG